MHAGRADRMVFAKDDSEARRVPEVRTAVSSPPDADPAARPVARYLNFLLSDAPGPTAQEPCCKVCEIP